MPRRYGIFCIAIGFAGGTLARSLLPFGWPAIGFILLLAGIVCVAAHSTKSQAYILAALILVSAAAGATRARYAESALPPAYVPLIGTRAALTGTVAAEPDMRESSTRVVVRTTYEGVETKALAVLPPYPPVSYGERIRVEGTLEVPEPFESAGGRQFRYDRYLAKDGIYLAMPRASFAFEAPAAGFFAHALQALYGIKEVFVNGINRALPEPASGLAAGLLVGGKQGLGQDLYRAFIIAGLVHIIVLSGYNVMIVANALMRVFGFLPRRIAAGIGGATILLFVLAAGAGSASVRAGLMAVLALFARATGRTYDALRGLAFVALIMLLYNPLTLGYDVGFQFSIAATAGLIVGTPIALRWVGFMRPAFLREIAASTIAAQAGVLPILLYQTGNLSPYALPANLLVLPIIPLAMLLSAAAAIVGIILPIAAPLAGLPAYLALSYVLFIGAHVRDLPFAGTVLPAFNFFFVIGAYALLIWFVLQAQKRGARPA